MYLKTTSPQFLQYGLVSDAPSDFSVKRNAYEGKQSDTLRSNSHPVSFQVIEGIAVLIIETPDASLHEFVIHRRAILDANIPYTIIALTQSVLVEESVQTDAPYQEIVKKAGRLIEHKPIQPQFYISDIFSYYYSVKGQKYHFDGESHYYWEITYVDTGELIIELDGTEHKLNNQDLMIYLPGQFHKQRIAESKTCSYFTIMFDMNGPIGLFDQLKNQVIQCTQQMYALINQFIRQSNLLETDELPFTRDLMMSYLQELIILMMQSKSDHELLIITNINPAQNKFENEMVDEITNYILKEIYSPITVEDICDNFGVSRSTLQSLFKKHLGVPPKQYINDMKMRRAQQIILQENVPITEVSLRLGFSSIHYFSRKFKKEFGLSPSEFAQSVYQTSHDA